MMELWSAMWNLVNQAMVSVKEAKLSMLVGGAALAAMEAMS